MQPSPDYSKPPPMSWAAMARQAIPPPPAYQQTPFHLQHQPCHQAGTGNGGSVYGYAQPPPQYAQQSTHLPQPHLDVRPQSQGVQGHYHLQQHRNTVTVRASPAPAPVVLPQQQMGQQQQKQQQQQPEEEEASDWGDWGNTDMEMRIRNKTGLVINNRYRVCGRIATGSYGAIFEADDLLLPPRRVAVKFETSSVSDSHLEYEREVYSCLASGDRATRKKQHRGEISRVPPGVPAVHWSGDEYGYRILVLDLLGPSLEQLFSFAGKRISRRSLARIGIQLVSLLRLLHSKGYIHRDIKPDNLLMGIGEDEDQLHLVDFGLSRRYRFRDRSVDSHPLRHIPYRKGKQLVGTAPYASLNAHAGVELSRRDDVESAGYVLVQLAMGQLPWKTMKKNHFRNKQQGYNKIRSIKDSFDFGRRCPALAEWIAYARGMDYDEEPDYDRLLGYMYAICPELKGEKEEEEKEKRDESPVIDGVIEGLGGVTIVEEKEEKEEEESPSEWIADGLTSFADFVRHPNDKRFDWIMRRESSEQQRNVWKTLYFWADVC